MKVKSESEVAQSCLTPSNPMDCSLPGSSVHGIFQARVLEWGASWGSSLVNGKLWGQKEDDLGSTPEFLLGESQGQGSLVGCRLWGRTESDTTEVT